LKVAISSSGDNLQSFSHLDFISAPYFIIYDLASDSYKSVTNVYATGVKSGVGIKVAQALMEEGIKAIISDGFDPWVFQFFKFSGVELFKILPMRVIDVLEKFKKGDLRRWEPEVSSFFKNFFTYFHFPFGWFFEWGSPFDWKTIRIAQLEAMISALEAQLDILRKELEDLKRRG